MKVRHKVGRYWNFAAGARQYLRAPMKQDLRDTFLRQLQNRQERWLKTIRRGVFEVGPNPYREMFRIAGCTFQDLAGLVRSDGLESALAAVHGAGVFVTHDEFKGKTPIVRSGQTIPHEQDSFANPFVTGGLEAVSSGSRSSGTPTLHSLDFVMYRHVYQEMEIREFELRDKALVIVQPVLPAISGLTSCLRLARFGCPPHEWFAPGGSLADSSHYRGLTSLLIAAARLHGFKCPYPQHLAPNDFRRAAGWIADQRGRGLTPVARAFVSPAVRVAAAALEEGLDISGALFFVGGEALTDAKRQVIESAGCQAFPRYGISEVGAIGSACSQMGEGNCVHLFRDSVAVIEHRQVAPLSGMQVNALLFTTLLPTAPNLLINAGMDDAGVVGRASCDCHYSAAGLVDQISHISSFWKLTGQGVSLVGSQVLALLESELPRRFGGAPTDYQLVEQEGPGQTQLVLRISPRAGVESTEAVRRVFLRNIRSLYGGALASRLWAHADAIEVIEAEPIATPGGKVLSLHLLSSPSGEDESS